MPAITPYTPIEDFQRNLQSVLAPYLSTGNSQWIMGQFVNFYNCQLLFSLDRLPVDPTAQPFICFAGSRSSAPQVEKSRDKLLAREFGYEVIQTIFRTAYVGIGRTEVINVPPYPTPPQNRVVNILDLERIWSQLFLVLNFKHKTFNAVGIHNPQIPAACAQQPHADYLLVRGEVSFQIRFPLARE